MIGGGYWATGVTVDHHPDYGWIATVEFHDDGFAEQGSTEGILRTRYFCGDGVLVSDKVTDALTTQIDLVIADAERLGIAFGRYPELPPAVYYKGDGEDPDYPAPDGWRTLLNRQAARLGWHCHHDDAAEVAS
jgi:FAD/FMN-containing dehydrogenase